MNNRLLRNSKTLPGNPTAFGDYREYLIAVPDASRLHVKLTKDHNLDPCVAALAILETDVRGIDEAIDFIFELSTESGKL